MPIRALLFDLGDTLMFQAHAPNEADLYARMAEQVGPLLRDWDAPAIDAIALLRDLYEAVRTGQPERRDRGYEVDGPFIARGALAAHGIDASPAQAAALWRATAVGPYDWGWQVYPDSADTVRRVRDLGLPAGVVSNSWYTSDLTPAFLAAAGIDPALFGVIVTSADTMRPKPHPAPFRHALDALGIDPAAAVFIGDDLEADIRGAKALGMTTVWKLNGRHELPPAPEADYTIHDLWELFTLDLLPSASPAALPQQSLTPHEDGNAGRY